MHLSVKIYGMAQNISCRSSLRGVVFCGPILGRGASAQIAPALRRWDMAFAFVSFLHSSLEISYHV